MIITSLIALGEQIREQRIKLGLTQIELAARVGSTRQWLSRLERGQEGASVQRLLVMCDVLDLRFTLEMPNRDESGSGESNSDSSALSSEGALGAHDYSYSDELRAKAEAAIAERLWRDPAMFVEKTVAH